ncbi:hypothetical protein [Actinoplanes sp. HUAS TT8]|uniref:hypothetical protein n=1 Tax=Actinoplanes sp. HUAS TT8 TaxID=3447453 RepID=UPI003F526B58
MTVMGAPTRIMPIDVTTPARIAALALRALGPSVHAVANTLTLAGYTGRPEQPGACPVARYLLASDPTLTAVAVDGRTVRLDRADETCWVTLPWPVERFVYRFDTGFYPQLVAATADASSQRDPLVCPGTINATEDRP